MLAYSTYFFSSALAFISAASKIVSGINNHIVTGEEDAMELPWRPTHVSPTPINVIQDPFSTQAVQSNNPQQGLTSSDLSQQSQQQTNQEKLGSPWNPADPLSSAHTPSKSPTMTSSNLNAIHGDLTNSFAPNERNHALKSNPSTIAPPFYQKTDGTSERQPDQSRSAHVSIIDDPFGVPSPLEVSDGVCVLIHHKDIFKLIVTQTGCELSIYAPD